MVSPYLWILVIIFWIFSRLLPLQKSIIGRGMQLSLQALIFIHNSIFFKYSELYSLQALMGSRLTITWFRSEIIPKRISQIAVVVIASKGKDYLWFFFDAGWFYHSSFLLTIEFRAYSPYGVIFFATNNVTTQFISLELVDGQLVYKFNSGGGLVQMRTTQNYAQGQWTQVLLYHSFIHSFIDCNIDSLFSSEHGKRIF